MSKTWFKKKVSHSRNEVWLSNSLDRPKNKNPLN